MYSWHFMTMLTAKWGPSWDSSRAVPSVRVFWSITLLIGMAVEPASAQSASFRSVDTDRNGILTLNELVATFGREGANRLLQSTDHDGDGRITISELRRGSDDDRNNDERPGSPNDRDYDRDDDREEGDSDGDDGGGDDNDGGDDGGDDRGDDD